MILFVFRRPRRLPTPALRNPENGSEEKMIPMLLDTGSDVTLIPQFCAEKLNLSLSRQFELAGFDNKKSFS